jgi:hypothetical protein
VEGAEMEESKAKRKKTLETKWELVEKQYTLDIGKEE